MTLPTLLKYLLGNRFAILQIAQCPGALWIGLVFVLAAGFAREYDGEDLLREPWHLLIPFVASLVSSFILYALIRLIAWRRRANEPAYFAGYRTFLTLYWLTAPLALLYAIPFERFFDAGDAMRANLWLLAIVATWRVLLITRVISVLYQSSYIAAFFPVMLFADTLLLVVLWMTPLPLLGIMGGVRRSEPDDVLLATTLFVGFAGYVSWLGWLFGSIFVVLGHSSWQYQGASQQPELHPAPSVWVMSAASLGIWLFVLPFTQPEQQLRYRVERLLEADEIQEALLLMSANQPDDFPPHWDPPPRITHSRPRPEMIVVQETAEALELKPWVRKLFDEKFTDSLRADSWVLNEMPLQEIDRRLRLLEQLPNRVSVVEGDLKGALAELKKRSDLSSQTLALVESLLDSKVQESDDNTPRNRLPSP